MVIDARYLWTIGLAFLCFACNEDVARQISREPRVRTEMRGQSPAPQKESPPQVSLPALKCRILVSEADFNRFAADKAGILENHFVEPGPLETCTNAAKASISGYNSFVVYPPVEVTGDARYVNGDIEVPIGAAEITEDFMRSVAAEFGLTGTDAKKLVFQRVSADGYPFEGHGEAQTLPRVQVRRKQTGSSTVLVLSRKKRLKEKKAKAFIEAFQEGRKGIRAYFHSGAASPNDEDTGSLTLHARGHKGKNRYRKASRLELLANFWEQAELAKPDPQDSELSDLAAEETPEQDRDEVLQIAVQWRYQLSRLSRERVREALKPMVAYASAKWLPSAPEPQAVSALSNLVALEFLGVFGGEAEGEGPVAPYYRQYLRLQPFFGYEPGPNGLAYLNEIIALVDHGILTTAQQEQVQILAGTMSGYEGGGNPAVWEKAKEFCARLGFDSVKIGRFSQLVSSVLREHWRFDVLEFAPKVLDFLLRRPDISDANRDAMSQILGWQAYEGESPFGNSGDLLAHAECLVFEREKVAEKLGRLQESYRLHLGLGLPAARALEHAETELLDRACPIPLPVHVAR